jgi:hypothetical protein
VLGLDIRGDFATRCGGKAVSLPTATENNSAIKTYTFASTDYKISACL